MSVQGLSNLVTTIMAAGTVSALPARDHRDLHAALYDLETMPCAAGETLWHRFGGRRTWKPDPSVGRRADGVTPALWAAVSAAHLEVLEDGRDAFYLLTERARVHGRRQLMRMTSEEADAIYGVGAAWAAASTARKKRASVLASPAAPRVSNLA